MASRSGRLSRVVTRAGHLGSSERLISVAAGLALTLIAARTGGGLRKVAASAIGLSLLGRGTTGYCGVKAAATSPTHLADGLLEQFHRLKSMLRGSGTSDIETMAEMYAAELQEQHSSEVQLGLLVSDLAVTVEHPALRHRLKGYAAELRSRRVDLGRILRAEGLNPRDHPDQAMHALIRETRKMGEICAPAVRDAGLVASLQRLIHYRIAGYGTVASYAKALGHIDEAARFAECAERDETMDAELSELARSTLNPQAATTPGSGKTLGGTVYTTGSETRTH